MQVVRRSNDDGGLSETDGVLGALLGHNLLVGPDGDASLHLHEGQLEDEGTLTGAAGIGTVLEDRSNAGSTRQGSFIFQLTLVEVKRGVAVWTDEKIVTKQGTKNAVGF